MAVTDNIKIRKQNFTVKDGYFYTLDDDQDALLQKTDDGNTSFSYPCDSVLDSEVKTLEFDGIYFWSLEEDPATASPADNILYVKKWKIDNYICKLQQTITINSSSSHYMNSDCFTVEHYHTNISTTISGGATTLYIDDYWNNTDVLPASTAQLLHLGPNSNGEEEDVNITTTISGGVTLDSGTLYDYIATDEVNFHKHLWVFNNNDGNDDTTGALYKFSSDNGGYMDKYAGGAYKDIHASTFANISSFTSLGSKDMLLYTKGTNTLFVNIYDTYSASAGVIVAGGTSEDNTDAITYVDGFTGSYGSNPNPNYWSVSVADPAKCYISSNRLKMYTPSIEVVDLAFLYYLVGDFDFYIDVRDQFFGGDIYRGLLTYIDDFTGANGSPPDTNYWSRTVYGSGSVCNIVSNRLRMYTYDAASSSTISLDFAYKLIGDFDFYIDVRDQYYASALLSNFTLKILYDYEAATTYIRRDLGPNNRFYSDSTGPLFDTPDEVTTSGTDYSFRMKRTGSTVYSYYREFTGETPGAWTLLHQVDAFDSRVSINLYQNSYPAYEYTNYLDNFTFLQETNVYKSFDYASAYFTLSASYIYESSTTYIKKEVDTGYGNFISGSTGSIFSVDNSVTTSGTDYSFRMKRTGSTVYSYYREFTGETPGAWTLLHQVDAFDSTVSFGFNQVSNTGVVYTNYLDNFTFLQETNVYRIGSGSSQSGGFTGTALYYYGSMVMNNIENDGYTIDPLVDMSIDRNNMYRLHNAGSTYSYNLSPLESFVTSISVSSSPAIIAANGLSTADIKAIAKDQFLQAIVGRRITFSSDGDGSITGPIFINTDTDGESNTEYTSGTTARSVKFTSIMEQT